LKHFFKDKAFTKNDLPNTEIKKAPKTVKSSDGDSLPESDNAILLSDSDNPILLSDSGKLAILIDKNLTNSEIRRELLKIITEKFP